MTTGAPVRIGRYALLGRVGRGGMGEVHRARAYGAAGVTKDLCIKRIRKSRLSDPKALQRFVDEARLWMRLSHGNIVPVFDFGRIENDYFLAMEWVDGCDLLRLIGDADAQRAPLEDDVLTFVGAAVARALAYLHDAAAHEGRAVAHCDLKPSNVLTSRSGEVKLADFGVAVLAESERAGGTRGYVPPTEPEGGPVGARSDLFALGRLLGDLLEAGGGAESETRRDLAALAAALVGDTPPDAAEVESRLEALLARARVASGRSPREALAGRVRVVARPVAESAPVEVETDASFLAGGAEASFLSQMEGATERTASTRAPSPPPPSRIPWRAALVLAGVAAAALVAVRWASGPTTAASVPSTADATVAPREPAPERATPEATRDEPVVGATAELDRAAPTPATPVENEPARAPTRPEGRSTARRERVPVASAPEPTLAVEEAPAPAHLRVNARPWAEVTIDGVPRGPTPILDLELRPGAHTIELEHPASGRRHEATIELAPGESRDLVVDLRS